MTARIHALAAAVLAALLACCAAPAAAQGEGAANDLRSFACPLGGKTFRQDVGYFALPLVIMPDGSWLGDTEIGVQVPVCPDNGLVILPDLDDAGGDEADGSQRLAYRTYTAAELAALPALVADPQYRALKADGPYAQAWWIADQLGHSPASRFALLQRSTWATRDPALRKRLVARFVEHGAALIARFPETDRRKSYSQLLIVNALRELGRFDEALARLDAFDLELTANDPIGPDYDYAAKLRLAITQHDDGRFAVETLPDRMVGVICGGEMTAAYGSTTQATKASCKIRRDREAQEQRDRAAAYALRDDSTALARSCADTAPAKRSAALAQACEMLQDELDELAANELTRDGPGLAAKCDAIKGEIHEAVMGHACRKYGMALSSALAEQLAADADAFALFCPDVAADSWAEAGSRVSFACVDAELKLKRQAEQRLLADPAKLAGLCARQEEAPEGSMRDYEILLRACSSYEMDQEMAAVTRLAGDAAAFDSDCGRFQQTNSAGNEVFDLTEGQERCRKAWRQRENGKFRASAEAKGLKCFSDAIYSPDRPRCVSPEEYAVEMAPAKPNGPDRYDLSYLEDGSSLMQAAHSRAASIIADAKRLRRRPDEI
ncbi:MAG: hypothetical protein ACO25F_00165 [Erythrobacter sp.]